MNIIRAYINRFHNWRKRIFRGGLIRIKRIFSPDFWVCEYESQSWLDKGVETKAEGFCAVFGKTHDEALKDADLFIAKSVKIPPEVKGLIQIVIRVRKARLSERINATAQDLNMRRIV